MLIARFWAVIAAALGAFWPGLVLADVQSDTAARAEIHVSVTGDSEASVSARYPVMQPTSARTPKLTYLLPAETSITNLHVVSSASEQQFRQQRSGPWVLILFDHPAVQQSGAREFRVSYDVHATVGSKGIYFTVPICMPAGSLDSLDRERTRDVEISISDATKSIVQSVTLPRIQRISPGIWAGRFPAVPSWIILHIANRADRASSISNAPAYPTGTFYGNFWGLIATLIVWTVVYLIWANRGKRSKS